jgi:hypothetical protein
MPHSYSTPYLCLDHKYIQQAAVGQLLQGSGTKQASGDWRWCRPAYAAGPQGDPPSIQSTSPK